MTDQVKIFRQDGRGYAIGVPEDNATKTKCDDVMGHSALEESPDIPSSDSSVDAQENECEPTIKQKNKWPLFGITIPGENDCLMGRGGKFRVDGTSLSNRKFSTHRSLNFLRAKVGRTAIPGM